MFVLDLYMGATTKKKQLRERVNHTRRLKQVYDEDKTEFILIVQHISYIFKMDLRVPILTIIYTGTVHSAFNLIDLTVLLFIYTSLSLSLSLSLTVSLSLAPPLSLSLCVYIYIYMYILVLSGPVKPELGVILSGQENHSGAEHLNCPGGELIFFFVFLVYTTNWKTGGK